MSKKSPFSRCSRALVAVAGLLAPVVALADAVPQNPPNVPEPSAWLVFGLGALGVGWAVRRRKRD